MSKHWIDSDDPRRIQRGAFGSMTFWVIGVLVVVLVLSAAVWLLGVGTSGARGKGDAYQQKNSAQNWVSAQKEFNDRYQGILATDRKISDAREAWDAAPNDAVLKTNYVGLKNNCSDAVGEYNSLARSYMAQDFRDADLPAQIDLNDPTTDCKENIK